MRYAVRTRIGGIEYWDTEQQRNVFVPNGSAIVSGTIPSAKLQTNNAIKLEYNDLTIRQLADYASQCNITIPKEITRRQDIINYLSGDHSG